ncbi:unnamed protein product [Didymodactylos carnosus]|uniref:Uncharacterized protein n=1 Tax=Didymodactylos carnosus TaxID=1234261 RepID=A0A8S2D185_9BILA|nr:unnamed protein product [Didymodactylos carnosus]CAF3560395.1 unnamed protein product [Didymodactylos carnosus]
MRPCQLFDSVISGKELNGTSSSSSLIVIFLLGISFTRLIDVLYAHGQFTFSFLDGTTKCITRHRLSDGHADCSNEEDELDLHTCSMNLPYRFKCDQNTKCIRRELLKDGKYQCDDYTDETSITEVCYNFATYECDAYRGNKELPLLFEQICNGITEIMPFFSAEEETDETHCREQQWSCDTHYTHCNKVWNCVDGKDELDCPKLLAARHCEGKEHYCLPVDTTAITPTCLPLKKVNDGYIDCLGSIDEREFCRRHYPANPTMRYRCLDSNKCISPGDLCNCREDCPQGDDERRVCPWLNSTNCKSGQYLCSDGEYKSHVIRCDATEDCRSHEDDRFCDLIDKSIIVPFDLGHRFGHLFDDYPSREIRSITQKFDQDEQNNDYVAWYCNRGVLIHGREEKNDTCLCPPSYYGDRCQYQRKRLSVVLQIQKLTAFDINRTFKLLVYLYDNKNDKIVSHEQIVYLSLTLCLPKYTFNLLYPIGETHRNYSVYIHVFTIEEDYIVYNKLSWYFDVKYQFLPVNRLAKRLILTDSDKSTTGISCDSYCLNNGLCLPFVNDERKFYCQCQPGWTGHRCHLPQRCNCSQGSLCIDQAICICPLNRIGQYCLVPFNPCRHHHCENNGTCQPIDERYTNTHEPLSTLKHYHCRCTNEYTGHYCDGKKAQLDIHFDNNINVETSDILIHTIEPYADDQPQQSVYFQRMYIYERQLKFYYEKKFLPALIFVQLYDNQQKPNYYLVLLKTKQTPRKRNETTKVRANYRCPSIVELFNHTVVEYEQLQRIKFYQQPCRKKQVKCFYEQKMMCVCDKQNDVDCFEFKTQLFGCGPKAEDYCNNNGLCIQNDELCPKQTVCLCNNCFYGSQCQHSTSGYAVSLNSIIGSYIILNTPLKHQPSYIKLSLILLTLLLTVGLISNSLSILTFSLKSKTRDVGCGFYLLFSSLFGLLTLLFILIKFIYLLTLSSNHLGCTLIEYFLKSLPTISDWLNACVAVDRYTTILYKLKFNKKLSIKCSKYMVSLVICLVLITLVHEPIYRQIKIDTYDQRSWCVLNINKQQQWLIRYNSTINILHFILPLIINILSAILIILHALRSKLSSTTLSRTQVLIKHRHILIGPCALIILTLPRLILNFVLVCTKLDRRPLPNLIAYFISYLPSISILFGFILPSPTYSQEFFDLINKWFIPTYFRRQASTQTKSNQLRNK